jgi:hypothetical protein
MKLCNCPLAWGALVGAFLCGCQTPFSVSGGFFGASVTANFPNGISTPARVVPSAGVVAPTLLVPETAPVSTGTVPVVTATGQTSSVPVMVAPVNAPVLAVPAKP